MDNIDGNLNALRRYEETVDKADVSYKFLLEHLDDRLFDLRVEIGEILQVASDYDGYDFSYELQDEIRGMV